MSSPLFRHEFTYFTKDGEEEGNIISILKELAKKYCFQLEKTPTTDKLHYQGCLSLREKARPLSLAARLASLGMPGVTVRPVSNNGTYSVYDYCKKNTTREKGPWADKPIYLGQDLITSFRPWQQEIYDLIQGEPDKRKIYWYYDEVGGAGKTSFSKYMWFHHAILTLTIGKASDLLNLVYKKQGLPTYIFDISRTVQAGAMTEIYAALESVKNGYFVNQKYETGVACFAIPHIIVFSNMLPKMSALSRDRWVIVDMCQKFQEI